MSLTCLIDIIDPDKTDNSNNSNTTASDKDKNTQVGNNR